VELRLALAARVGVDVSQVVAGCGSVALCQQIVQAFAGPADEVLFSWRSFEAYPIVSAIAGAIPVAAPLHADQSLDLDALAAAVSGATRVVFVCSPNNPTSTAVSGRDLRAFLDGVRDDVLIVLDEAYREFVTDPDVADGLALLDRANVIVLRTFSKAYGLAGLRVGYGIAADPAVAEAIGKVQIPFAVNAVAQQAALACLLPETEKQLFERVEEVVAERARVQESLRGLGYSVPPSQANFVWLPLGDRTTAFNRHCEDGGVIVRAFVGDGVRVTIGTPPENDLFLAAAASFVSR
jgi:histidinol-phosphate aminotransferase